MKKFRTYQLSVAFYKTCKEVRLFRSLKDQLLRASSSVCLNLAEGSARRTEKDRMRFYNIALASHREVQSIIDIEELGILEADADKLGAHLYKLTHP